MQNRHWVVAVLMVGMAAGLLLTTGCGKQAGPSALQSETLKNLQTAYNGESNAEAKYQEYAKKADEEGYHQVASLFRAAAMSEGFHARNHAAVIRSLGAEPMAEITLPEIKTTSENLDDALQGETYENAKMYADFRTQAQADGLRGAVQTFTWAQRAEAEHAKYYQAALDNLDEWKDGQKDFLVCSRCGYTTTQLDLQKCPVCSEPRDEFKEVS
jgi:rubrerythrin